MTAPARTRAARFAPPAETVDRLRYLASRAPSAHNAQPWTVEADGARLRVRVDPAHLVMRELDPHGRETDLACGAAVRNLVVGAESLGLRADVAWRPEPGVAADVVLAPGGGGPSRLAAIRDRAMNRSAYAAEPVDPDVLERLRATASGAGLTLSVATEPAAIAEVAVAAGAAGRMKLSHAPTQRELHALMRFSGADAARARDGLDLELFFAAGPAWAAAVAMRPRVLDALEPLRVSATVARDAEEAPLRSAPAVCLLHAEHVDEDTFLRAGECFQEIGLQIAEAGLAYAMHSAPVELGLSDPLHPSVPGEWHREIAEVHDRLLRAVGAPSGAVPVALFRVGTPTKRPGRRSLRRPLRAAAPPSEHYAELTRRNQPSIPPADQEALRALRVLFAGCGSIGGAPVEPLVRMGLEQLVLAEPGDYETNNLNRQAATMADIGRNKAAVLADRARAINPHAHALVEPAGVTVENVDWLVGTTDVVIDGVDVTEASGIAAKRLLHEEAWRQRRLVIAGLDLGGTQLVLVYDYRDPKVRPFGGRLDGVGEVDALGLLSRLIRPLDMPREMLGYAESVICGRDDSPPQLAPTADLFGVLAAWAVLDFACGRPLRPRVKVAIPNLLMTRSRRVRNEAARLAQLARVKLLLEVKRARKAV